MWTFHRIIHGPSKQIEVPGHDIVVPRPGANGATVMVTIRGQPTFRRVHQKINEAIQLLMLDGKYITYSYSVVKEQVTE